MYNLIIKCRLTSFVYERVS